MSDTEQRRKPVDYDELFVNRFLKAGLLRNKPATLTIRDVEIEKLPQDDGRDRPRGIISFKETERELVLNSTNGQCIRAMFGRRVPDWIGKRVTIAPAQDRFGGKMVDCIRVVGSPDIAESIDAEIALPRKKPKIVRLEKTGNGSAKARPTPESEPPHDPETGEVREPGSDG